MSNYQELVTILKELLFNRFYPKPQYIRGLLGDGRGNVLVPERPDYNYVRFSRASSETFEVFNKEVSQPVDGWPVLIGEFPWTPGLIQVVATDWSAYAQTGWGDEMASIQAHAPTHEWPNFIPGSDPLNVYLRAITPMRTQAAASGSTSVMVTAYEYDGATGTNYAWPGLPELALGAATPSTGTMRYMGVYLNPATNTLGVVTGSTTIFTDALEPPRPAWPRGVMPTAYVRLYGGQSQINERDIRDARRLWESTLIYTGALGPHNLLSQFHPDTLTANVVSGDLIYGSSTPKWTRLPIVTGSYLGSLAGTPTWTNVTQLAAPDGNPNPALWVDNSGNSNTPSGTDINIATDEAGVRQRQTGLWSAVVEDDFIGNNFASAWTFAGSPFIIPSGINFSVNSMALIGHNVANQRIFIYRTDAITNISNYITASPNVLADDAYFGYRYDDGSDNNYVEAVIRKTNAVETLETFSRVRTGGGGVTLNVRHTIYNFPMLFTIGFTNGGTQWTNWSAALRFSNEGPATRAVTIASGLTWTPTRRGITIFNANTTVATSGPFIDKELSF